MSRTRILRRESLALLAGAGCLALLTACGGSTADEPDEPATGSASASESATPSPTETATSSPSAGSTTPTPTQAPLPSDAPLADRLIPADELPGLNDEWAWREVATRPAGAQAFGRCAKFDMLSVGALEGVTRTYSGDVPPAKGGAGRAAMQVLDFADAKTVLRASAVVRSWHSSCQQRTRDRIGPLRKVSVYGGTGTWYLLTTPDSARDEGHFHAFGIATLGKRMALISMDNDGQDRNYEPGQDPMELAVAAAAGRLG